MKIVTIVRTRNEVRNIERFCGSYQWADLILVADGGSEDDTVWIARNQAKTKVRRFHKRKLMANGLWRNPEAEHLNFLVDWALQEGADWIIEDDCDCVPNYRLKRDAREIIENSTHDFVSATRLYLWGPGFHFPLMAQPGANRRWEAGLWAWRATVPLRFHNTDAAYLYSPLPVEENRQDIYPPYCLLHYSWIDEFVLQDKLKFYQNSGQIPGILHPLQYAGVPEPLPEWAHE